MATSVSVSIDLPEAKRLADLAGIRADLRSCRDHCQLYLEFWSNGRFSHPDAAKYMEAVVTCVFTKYGRCFKGGVRRETEKELLGILTEDDKRVHQLTLDIRDKHIAHSVNGFEHHTATAWLRMDGESKKFTNVSVGSYYTAAPDLFVFQNTIILIDKLLCWIREEEARESLRLKAIVESRYTLEQLCNLVGNGSAPIMRVEDVAKSRKHT